MNSEQTKDLQLSLIAQGYPLPRWGADGHWGMETEAALRKWRDDHVSLLPPTRDMTKLDAEDTAIYCLRHGSQLLHVVPGQRILDVREEHPGKARKGVNSWGAIDTICLHQMSCDDGTETPGKWQRWKDLAIHFAVLRHGESVWLYDLNVLLHHGHGWNGRSVGLEIEGWFAGLAGNPETLWVPKHATAARKKAMVPNEGQVEAAQQSIRLAVATVAVHGGKIKYIAAHRQSYGEKVSDPGELLWKAVALPMMAELKLREAPTLKGGKRIPTEWGGAAGVPY